MTYLIKIIICTMTALLLCSTAFANTSEEDGKQPIEITSDTGSFDNIKGIAVYEGRVKVTQGSRLLTADRLELHRDAAGNAHKFIATGSPARYQSKTSPDKPLLHAKANTIEYDVQQQLLSLIGDARVEQDHDLYSAPRIEYDQKTGSVHSPSDKKGRTRIIIKPRENQTTIPLINTNP